MKIFYSLEICIPVLVLSMFSTFVFHLTNAQHNLENSAKYILLLSISMFLLYHKACDAIAEGRVFKNGFIVVRKIFEFLN